MNKGDVESIVLAVLSGLFALGSALVKTRRSINREDALEQRILEECERRYGCVGSTEEDQTTNGR